MLSLRTKYYLVLRERRTIFFCHHGDQSSVLVCLLSWRWLNTVNCGNDTMKWTSLLALSLWSSEDCSGGFLWKREFHLFSEVKEKVVADLLFKVTSTVIAPFTIVLRVFYEINYPFLTDEKKKKRIFKTRIAQPYWYIPWLWIESWGPDVFLGSLIILLPDVILASAYLRTIGTVYERKKFSLDLREHWKTNLLNIHAE